MYLNKNRLFRRIVSQSVRSKEEYKKHCRLLATEDILVIMELVTKYLRKKPSLAWKTVNDDK